MTNEIEATIILSYYMLSLTIRVSTFYFNLVPDTGEMLLANYKQWGSVVRILLQEDPQAE